MNLSRIFIERPVMTALVTFAILLFGVVAFRALPVAALPAWTIRRSRSGRRAGRESGDDGVVGGDAARARVLDHRRHRVDELGQLAGQHADHGAVHARPQDRRRGAGHPGGDLARRRRLPPMPRPPSYQKVNPAEQPVLYLALDSTTLPMYTVNEYADTMLAQRISMVNGVSRVQIFGAQKYAVRVQVDPDSAGGAQHRHRRSADAPSRPATPICRPDGWTATNRRSRSNRPARCERARRSGRSSWRGGTGRRCGWSRSPT